MRMHPLIEAHGAELLALARRRGVTGVRVFGSMSRGDGSDHSDVDLLVTLAPGVSALALGGAADGRAGVAGPPRGRGHRIESAPGASGWRGGCRCPTVTPGPDADRVLLAQMRDCLDRIREHTDGERARFDASRLVQDAVIRNLQTLADSSQRLSTEIKATKVQIPWRELSGLRNVIVHGYLGVDLGAVWLVVEQDLPALSDAVSRMALRRGSQA